MIFFFCHSFQWMLKIKLHFPNEKRKKKMCPSQWKFIFLVSIFKSYWIDNECLLDKFENLEVMNFLSRKNEEKSQWKMTKNLTKNCRFIWLYFVFLFILLPVFSLHLSVHSFSSIFSLKKSEIHLQENFSRSSF